MAGNKLYDWQGMEILKFKIVVKNIKISKSS